MPPCRSSSCCRPWAPTATAVCCDDPQRVRAVNADVEAMGVKVLAQYALLGQYDFLNILEAPDEVTMAKVATTLAARGTLKTLDPHRHRRRHLHRRPRRASASPAGRRSPDAHVGPGSPPRRTGRRSQSARRSRGVSPARRAMVDCRPDVAEGHGSLLGAAVDVPLWWCDQAESGRGSCRCTPRPPRGAGSRAGTRRWCVRRHRGGPAPAPPP